MAHLNVLPQVSAKPNDLHGNEGLKKKDQASVGSHDADLSHDFKKDLAQAKTAEERQDSKKAAEKGQLLAAAAQQMSQPKIPLKTGATSKATQEQVKELQGKLEKTVRQADQHLHVGANGAKTSASPQSLNQQLIQQLHSKLGANPAGVQAQAENQVQGVKVSPQAEAAMAAAHVANGASLTHLAGDHAFDVESLDVKEDSAKSAPKLSTSEYLNLRQLSQHSPNAQKIQPQNQPVTAKDAISAQNLALQSPTLSQALSSSPLGVKGLSLEKDRKTHGQDAPAAAVISLHHAQHGMGAKIVDAPVTQGSQQKMVLSHDALHQITQQVNVLNQAKQDGEIRIRLRPDHLGELQMSVKTQGRNVSIQIKAHDGEAKKIIEESLASLKDSLSQQNLSLSRIDVVTQPQAAQPDSGLQPDLSQFQGQFRQGHDHPGSEAGARQDRHFEDESKTVNLNRTHRLAQRSVRRAGGTGSARLDLIA